LSVFISTHLLQHFNTESTKNLGKNCIFAAEIQNDN
jgi:hypothetical protein